MTLRIPEDVSTWRLDSNITPPRDPRDDEDEDEEDDEEEERHEEPAVIREPDPDE
jgi:hypothetical protein